MNRQIYNPTGKPMHQQQQIQQLSEPHFRHYSSSNNGGGGGRFRDEPLSKTNVFIRGLPTNSSDDDLYNMCAKYGHILSSKSITDRTTNQCKGYGFVNFENQIDAENAVRELNESGYLAKMSKANVRSTEGMIRAPQRRAPDFSRRNSSFFAVPRYMNGGGSRGMRPLSKTNIYLRSLDVRTTDNDLSELCSRYGNILSVKAIINRDTNECKGYGFVNFDSEFSAEQAINDLTAKGYQVSMSRENRNGVSGPAAMVVDGPGDSWQ